MVTVIPKVQGALADCLRTDVAEIDENNLTLVGVIGEEDVSLFNLHARFAQAEVGNDIVVSLYVAALEGDHKDNYWLALEGAPTTTASIITPTSAYHSTLATVRAYPNPFNSFIYFDAEESIAAVSITSVTGQLVLRQKLNGEQQIDMGHLPSGLYIVKIELLGGYQEAFRMVRK